MEEAPTLRMFLRVSGKVCSAAPYLDSPLTHALICEARSGKNSKEFDGQQSQAQLAANTIMLLQG